MKRFSIVGAGRLGTVLGAALVRRGWRIEAIVDRDARAARESRRMIGGGRASTSLAAAARAAGTVIVAVPDDAIAGIARDLARAGGSWPGRDVFHTSGIVTAGALDPLAARGARVASLHPVQSFPRKDLPAAVFRGITWGVEGSSEAVEAATAIVRALGGHVLLLAARDKALYHAACVLASNALVALEWTAAGLLHKAGLAESAAVRTLLPLVQGTLQNVKSLGLEKALTGPILRGDVETVRRHLKAVKGDPDARRVYKVLGGQVLRLAASGNGLSAGKIRSLRRLLEGR
jgi:predicted short-subunit dehydrogenase-like oxidoreductase (DUF2520 family)